MTTCDMCQETAAVVIQYGTANGIAQRGEMRKLTVCNKHKDEIWEKCHNAVNAGCMAWSISGANQIQ